MLAKAKNARPRPARRRLKLLGLALLLGAFLAAGTQLSLPHSSSAATPMLITHIHRQARIGALPNDIVVVLPVGQISTGDASNTRGSN